MAAGSRDPIGRLLVFGVNHRSATAGLRERLLVEESDQPAWLAELRALRMDEVMALSTCDRNEVIAVHEDPEAVRPALVTLFAHRAGVGPEDLEAQSYLHLGEAALRHVFAVAASLDSQVIGEPQVLGQVKESHRTAAGAGTLGRGLEAVLQGAYAAAKRVRSETAIAERPVSMAAAAIMVARSLHGDLKRCRGLVLGLGEMGDLMALELKQYGLSDLVVMHGSRARAEAAAHRLRCHFRPWEELAEALADADIVVTALGTGHHTMTAALAEAALKRRLRRPLLFVDTAVPGDVEAAVEDLDGAYVYDLDDLEGVAREGKASREATSLAAWRILGEELSAFQRGHAERAAAPAISALRRHFEAARREVLAEKSLDAEAATRLLIGRLLHGPSEALRAAAAETGEGHDLERAIERIFRLDRQTPGAGGEEESES